MIFNIKTQASVGLMLYVGTESERGVCCVFTLAALMPLVLQHYGRIMDNVPAPWHMLYKSAYTTVFAVAVVVFCCCCAFIELMADRGAKELTVYVCVRVVNLIASQPAAMRMLN